jgi:beta-phosphoglucomutase
MRCSAVIFDFNGTLYWDTHLHNAAWDTFLLQHNIYISDQEKGRVMHGKVNQEILKYIMGEHLTPEETARYTHEKEQIYRDLCVKEQLQLAPGVEEFLEHLKQNNIKFTIATSSGKENVDFYFDYLHLGKWFDYGKVVFNDGSVKGKPDPDIFLRAMQLMEANPAETIIFEDTLTGVTAALAANPGKVIVVKSDPANFFDHDLDSITHFFGVRLDL